MDTGCRTLSLRLKSLEEKGWGLRDVLMDRPPRVLYSLTDRGIMVAKMVGPTYLHIRLSEEDWGTLLPKTGFSKSLIDDPGFGLSFSTREERIW